MPSWKLLSTQVDRKSLGTVHLVATRVQSASLRSQSQRVFVLIRIPPSSLTTPSAHVSLEFGVRDVYRRIRMFGTTGRAPQLRQLVRTAQLRRGLVKLFL